MKIPFSVSILLMPIIAFAQGLDDADHIEFYLKENLVEKHMSRVVESTQSTARYSLSSRDVGALIYLIDNEEISTINGKKITSLGIQGDTYSDFLKRRSLIERPIETPTEEILKQEFPRLSSKNTNVEALIARTKSKEAERCREAANIVNNITQNHGIYDDYLAKDFDEYRDSCGLTSLSAHKNESIRDLAHRLVVFIKKINNKNTAYCNGFILSDTTVVTARHCIYPNSLGSEYRVFVNDGNNTELVDFNVKDIACNEIHKDKNKNLFVSYQSCDYIFLIKDKLLNDYTYSKFPISSVALADKLTIVGYNYMNHSYESFISKRLGGSEVGWDSGMVASDSAECIVLDDKKTKNEDFENKCFLHACQTTVGMSGSPVFVNYDKGIKFAGLQIGTAQFDYMAWYDEQDNCYQKDVFDKATMNLGITVPIKL